MSAEKTLLWFLVSKIITRGALIPLALLLTSCATIISGSTQAVALKSDPSGATVLVEPGGQKVTTPTIVQLERKKVPYLLTFTKDGYAPYQKCLDYEGNNLSSLQILLFPIGIIGLYVDGSSGAVYSLKDEEVSAKLGRLTVPDASPNGTGR